MVLGIWDWWDEPGFSYTHCDKCGTACGDECCGVHWAPDSDEILKWWKSITE